MSSKIAIITGGSRGLGKSMALHLAKKGVDVVITYNSKKEEAEAVIREIESSGRKAAALQLDVGNSKSFERFAADFKTTLKSKWDRGTFDFLVNNAGIGYKATLAETTEEQFDLVMNVHFKGVFFLTQKLVPMMEDGGKIINISSGLARFTQPGASVYGSIKAGIEHLTRYWATELGPRRITANVIAPGPIETDFGGGVVRDTPALNKHLAGLTALGRVGVADDIGGAVAAMLSDDNRWVNGQRIEVSGGMLI